MKLEIIGDLQGIKVLVDHETRSVILAGDYMPSIRFPIDNPDIQGFKIEQDARAALKTAQGE